MKKIILHLLIGMFSGLTVTAQQLSRDTLSLSLEDCVELALKNNFNLQSIALNEIANQEIYKQSKMQRMPYLNASIGESFTHSYSTGSDWSGNYSIITGITIYQGGYINNTIIKSRFAAEQSRCRTTQYKNDLTIQVLQAFLTFLGNEELLRYQNSVLKASEEQMKQGKIRFETGEILESDYQLLEAQHANDQNNMIETKINRDNSLNTLKNLMSIDLSQNIEIVYPNDTVLDEMGITPSETEVISLSMETLPNLKISDYNVAIAEAGVRISRSAYSPSLSLNAGLNSGHMSDFSKYGSQLTDRFNEQIGFTLSIPILNHNLTKSNVSQSQIALKQAKLERKQTELDIIQTLIQEYRSMVLAESKYRSSKIRQIAYLSSFNAYRTKFEQGSITTVELLQQQNNYISVLNDYIQGKYSFLLKRKILDVYMGKPVTL